MRGALAYAVGLFEAAGLGDDHHVGRHIIIHAHGLGLQLGDLVNHIHAVDDLAEHAVAPALHGGGGKVQEGVVGVVDEELRGGGVRVHGTGHGNGAAVVLQAVVGLVLHGLAGGLFIHADAEAAALDHEAVDDAVEDGVGVEAVIHILEEVGNGFGGLVRIEFQQDVAGRGFEKDVGVGHDAGLLSGKCWNAALAAEGGE